MKLISWNVNGIRACVGKNFMEFFNEVDADIFCLQETKLQENQIDLQLEGYYQYWNYAKKKGYSGTAIFTKKEPLNVIYGMGIEEHDQEGRLITLEFEDFYMVTVYTPNSQSELKRLNYRMKWEDDFKKYHDKIPVGLLKDVLRSVALQGQGKFVYTQVDTGYRTPLVKEALEMLCMAGLIYSVVHTDSNGVPLFAEAKEKYKRYIFMDTGLLQRVLELDLTDVLVSNDLRLVNRGALAEVFVGTELVKNRPLYLNDNLYCWHREKKDSNAEVDYVVSSNGTIYPIEVKSGTRGSMQSLRIFLDIKHLDKGVRTSLENFAAFDDILIYPLYAIANIYNRSSTSL